MAMEVSSQGLAAERLRGTHFAAAVFTNLTADHLDFHQTMEAYFDAKKRLFDVLAGQPRGGTGRSEYRRSVWPPPCGGTRSCKPPDHLWLRDRCPGAGGWISVSRRRRRPSGPLRPGATVAVELGFAGRFNVMNALAAMAVCGALGAPLEAMASALARMPAVPGRLERIEDPKGRHLFVDYAHTEDALRHVLQTLRETTPGRLICLFGCGGNRDPGKRPLMGAAVSEGADFSIVTSDNPRNEDPGAILSEILAGMDRRKPHLVDVGPGSGHPRRAARSTARRHRAARREGPRTLPGNRGAHATFRRPGSRPRSPWRRPVRRLRATGNCLVASEMGWGYDFGKS